MAYSRWKPDCDIYIYPDVGGGITCCGCSLETEHASREHMTPSEAMDHLLDHYLRGDKAPYEWISEQIRKDVAEDFILPVKR